MKIVLFVLLYLSSAVISYGIAFAYFSNKDKEVSRALKVLQAVLVSMLGPVSLMMAIVCTGFSAAIKTLLEVHRVLKHDGKLFFNPYSQSHTSYVAGRKVEDELVTEIAAGTLKNAGQLCFYNEVMVREALATGWTIEELTHIEDRMLMHNDFVRVHIFIPAGVMKC